MIDKEPKEGRLLLTAGRSTEFFPWFMEGGKITKVAGQRVYYTDSDGRERFTVNFAAVCDTKAEYDRLLKFTADGKAAVAALHADLTEKQIVAMTGSVAQKRTRRTR